MRLCALALTSLALLAPLQALAQNNEFLPPEQAFRFTTESDGTTVTVNWDVAPGYYLYKSRMGLDSATPGVTLGNPSYPEGEIHEDEYFGKQTVFRRTFSVSAPITGRSPDGQTVDLKLKLQGCADAGLCYPPTTWDAKVQLPAAPATSGSPGASGAKGIDAILALTRERSSGSQDVLPQDQAFQIDVTAAGPDRVQITWAIADNHYIYRSRLKAETTSDQARLGALTLPKGKIKTDEFFGEQEVYYNEVTAILPVSRPPGGELELPLAISYQGCEEDRICYPPTTKNFSVTLPPGTGSAVVETHVSEQDAKAEFIRTGNLFLVMGGFFVTGLLLAFTPCVLPMVPILSGIIAGQGSNVKTGRAFALSLSYVLGMAVTYTVAGAAFAAAGQQVQAVFQQPWILILFAGLFVVLALSMFGAFNIQMPTAIQTRLSQLSNRQASGTFGGVAVMGALSALIVTTCVAPPLIATYIVIGQSGDVARGVAALFSMSLGMGTPLLIVGTSAGKLLPKAGAWMDTVKRLFGVMMLGVAAWMLERIVPQYALLLWAVPVVIAAYLLLSTAKTFRSGAWVARFAGVAAAVYGAVLLAGATMGNTDPLAPLAAKHEELPFRTIKSVEDLEREVVAASASGRPVMVDFYADWCVSCKEMEKYTFTDSAVRAVLENAVLLRADVTLNDEHDQALLKHFGIFGPPTIAFYGADGQERANFRVVGYMKAPEFAALAKQALGAAPVAAQTDTTALATQ